MDMMSTGFDIGCLRPFLSLISFSNFFFSKFELPNLGCGLSVRVAYLPLFMVLNFEHHTGVFHLDLYQPFTMVTYKYSTFQHFPEILFYKFKKIIIRNERSSKH